MIRDRILEIRIAFAFWLALNTDPKSRKKQERFGRMNDLIRRRSPEQVRKMEIRRGLV